MQTVYVLSPQTARSGHSRHHWSEPRIGGIMDSLAASLTKARSHWCAGPWRYRICLPPPRGAKKRARAVVRRSGADQHLRAEGNEVDSYGHTSPEMHSEDGVAAATTLLVVSAKAT